MAIITVKSGGEAVRKSAALHSIGSRANHALDRVTPGRYKQSELEDMQMRSLPHETRSRNEPHKNARSTSRCNLASHD